MPEQIITNQELNSFGPITLVVIQPTSFCNLDCDYCYLPNRELKNQLSLDLIEPIFKNIFDSRFLGEEFTVCWHAGEPLTVSVSFYEEVFKKIQELDQKFNTKNCKIHQSFQTNGTLINPAWCDLFNKYNVHVGVSLDGPDFLHDAHRKTRKGLGTHASTMRGISYLQSNHIPFSIISVITQDSLDYPDEIFNFFMKNGITNVGFNLEELEGVNSSSSLEKAGTEERYRAFMKRFWQLIAESPEEFLLREFERICSLIYQGEKIKKSGLLTPFVMINIDSQGNFSTFDPELLSIKTEEYGDFIFGNVLVDSFESICHTEKFQRIYQDINAGFNLCKSTCKYFSICGGGAGSNKYWENGSFRTSETMACRYYEQIVTDIVLEELEKSLQINKNNLSKSSC